MSIIKIEISGNEIDYVKETLSIKKENNSLSRDFKISYSQNPFLVIENKNTKLLLGPKDITSINKLKVVDCVVIENGIKYVGEIQILSYLKGYRKCNLKYGSAILSIMNNKIAKFMPIVSVIPGETNPVPYTEKSDVLISGYSNWKTYPIAFLDKCFPLVKWQFPTLYWKNKFGIDLQSDAVWFNYRNEINKYNNDFTELIENSYSVDGSGSIIVVNTNVISPQVFLLSPLFYALTSIGWKITGDFYTSEFIRRLLLLSTKTNNTEVSLFGTVNNIDFTGISWTPVAGSTYQKFKNFAITETGTYIINYSFTYDGPVSGPFTQNGLLAAAPGDDAVQVVFLFLYLVDDKTFEGILEITANEIGNFLFVLQSKTQTMPTSYTLTLQKKESKVFQEMHPTIDTGRYVPDLTFANYLNELKNLFNLDIDLNDVTKTLIVNFNENIISSGNKIVSTKSMAINSYEQATYNCFLLKYNNSEDTALWISRSGIEIYSNQTSDFLETLQSKFKFVKNNTYTAELSEELEKKDGIGLMIYDPDYFPYIVSEYDSKNLQIDGVGGIYDVYWKGFLKFRINASILELEGPLTEVELSKIINQNRIYIDHQDFMIEYLNYSETKQQNYLVKFRIHSVTF